MGKYYRWVNVDRKEYISPADFGYGSKRYESCGYTNEVLGALRNLLFNEWKGCRVFWMGDESLLPENNDSELFSIMKAQCDALGSRGYMFLSKTKLKLRFEAENRLEKAGLHCK